jgi:hypothetical protein
VFARTGLLLTIGLAMLIFLVSARELSVASDAPPSSTDIVDATRSDVVEVAKANGLDDDVDDAVDLYGNEVTAAVATYKIDSTGALYELHSPQTEVPQLAPPKS